MIQKIIDREKKDEKFYKKIVINLLVFSIVIGFQNQANAKTVITKPKKSNLNAAIHYKGISTYYNDDLQKWKSVDGTLFYSRKAKKDTKYYKPIFYISNLWMANNGKDIKVTIGKSYERSVSTIVSATLGVQASVKLVELATSISGSYSETASYLNSYTTEYTFDMSFYSKKHMYRPAAFGNILSYWIVKTHRLTGNTII